MRKFINEHHFNNSSAYTVNTSSDVYRIIVRDISLKLDALGYISVAECLRLSSTTFTQCAPEAAEFLK